VFDRGFFTLTRLRGIPLRIHWSTALGALLFSGGRFAPTAWLGFFVLVIVHEFGHAAFVRWLRYRVVAIDVTGFGGLCRWTGNANPLERSIIAWGGVAAQAALLVVALALQAAGGFRVLPGGAELAYTFVWTNLWLMLLNLLPFPPLDGAEAWGLLAALRRSWRSRLDARAGRDLLQQILAQPARPRRARSSAPPPTGAAPVGGCPSAGSAAPDEPAAAAPGGTGPAELADLLRRIGDEAGRARRGGDR
jgi:stage IV sporulation protein FB